MNVIVFSPEEWGLPLPASDERAIHIREILRLEPGDGLRVGLLGGGVGQATVLAGPPGQNPRGRATGPLLLDFPDPAALEAAEPLLPLTLILGQPRPPVMQRLLKDLSALGVERILVVASDLSERSYMQSRLWQGHPAPGGGPEAAPAARGLPAAEAAAPEGAWHRQLIAGAQQGGHSFLPAVERLYSVRKAIEAMEPETTWPGQPAEATARQLRGGGPPPGRLVLDLVPETADLLGFCAGIQASGQPDDAAGWCLAIGPERGWSAHERNLFRERGFRAIGLGSRILRTETACILACGMLSLALQANPRTRKPNPVGPAEGRP